MTSPPDRSGQRLGEFDILRTVAVLLLILHHGGLYSFYVLGVKLVFLRDYVGLYLLGVFVFVAGSLCPISMDRHGLGEYLVGRLLRVYLPYLVALLIFLWLLDLNVSTMDVIAHLLGAQILLAPKLTTPILTLWFVGLILVYYLIFALLLRAFKRPISLLLASLAVLALAALLRQHTGFIHFRFFHYFLPFAAGAILTRARWRERDLASSRHWLILMLLASAIGVLLLIPLHGKTGRASLEVVGAITIYLLGTILLSLALARRLASHGWGARFFQFVSYASFFAYLLHRPIWHLLLHLYRPPTREGLSALLLISGFLLVIPISYLAQSGFDRLLRAFLPRFSPSGST